MTRNRLIYLTYKVVGSLDIGLDIWLPEEGDSADVQSKPALVWFHGGAGFCADKNPEKYQWFPTWVKDLAVKRNGWIFISANYRLLVPTTAHHMVEDINDVFKYISEELSSKPIESSKFTVDPARLAVGGESFGGYCARLAGLYSAPKPIAVVSLYGMGGNLLTPSFLEGRKLGGNYPMPFHIPLLQLPNPDIESLFQSKEVISSTMAAYTTNTDLLEPEPLPRQDMLNYNLQTGTYLDYLCGIEGLSKALKDKLDSQDASKGGEDSNWELIPEEARRVIPQLQLTNSFPPTFLIHGTEDTVASVDESRHTAQQLSKLGVENVELEFEGAPHVFDTGCLAEDDDDTFKKLKPVETWLQGKLGK